MHVLSSIMLSPYVLGSLLLVALFLLLVLRPFRSRAIANLSGPPPGSWLVGNIPELSRPTNVGDADFAWTKAYGNSLRIKGTFGRDVLFTTDPKAFHHILNTSCYNFPKSPEFRFLLAIVTGKGLVWAEGAQHSRHRKIMDSAFSFGIVRENLATFRQTTQQMMAKWKDIISQSESASSDIDVPPWMARTTLDILGTTAFDYQFGALAEESRSELYLAYDNLFVDAFLKRSDYTIAFESLCGILPGWILSILLNNIPDKSMNKIQNYMKVARRVARGLVDKQLESLGRGDESRKDILSLLVSKNKSLASKNTMRDDEMLSQLTTLMVAGHETTASTLCWVLYELSKQPKVQEELRKEIATARARASQRGDVDLSASDLDSMDLLGAVIKETLRYHPILPQMMRVAGRDSVIPLSTPQRTQSGEVIDSIPVRKGQAIILSVAAFNRLESVWGEDANVWRPQRFLKDTQGGQKSGLGVFANMATFSLGVRSCIGWRYAMLEMQAMVVEIVENFEFSPPHEKVEIVRAATTTMSPMVKGSKEGRAELPLHITPIN